MRNLFYLLILTFLFSACEKVIDVDLNDADPQIVIEGNLCSDNGFAEVKISMTSSYFDTVPGAKVKGAKVSVQDDKGRNYRFYEKKAGIYRSYEIRPAVNKTYKLSVESNGVKYEAQSTLKPEVKIDSVTWIFDEGNSFFDAGYYLNVYLTDPPQIDNYYRIKIYRNGKLKSSTDDLIFFNDRFVDGNIVEVSLFNDPYKLKDTVMVQLISLDSAVYEYFKTFGELINNNPGSAAPANPNTNLTNGALGYFSVWSSYTLSVIISD